MQSGKKWLLAAGLLAGAAMMTGCAANTRPAATPTPDARQETAAPATAQPAAQTQDMQPSETDAAAEETPAPLPISVEGKAIGADAIEEGGKLILPLEKTAEALSWKVNAEQTQGDEQTKRVVMLEKEGSRITVSWTVSDNTAKGITWQKDGLLIPVDTYLTTVDDVVYVPAAFFETAMDVTVTTTKDGVDIAPIEPLETPEKQVQETDGNG